MSAQNVDRVSSLLRGMQAVQLIEPPAARYIAYTAYVSRLSHGDLASLAIVLAEGNMFGADAAREIARVA